MRRVLASVESREPQQVQINTHPNPRLCVTYKLGAVNNADYALPQFKNLARLMLLHGRLCYLRISTLICYFFYKNLLFTICSCFYNVYCAFSGQYVFNEYAVTLYNTIFTQMPVLIFAVRACHISNLVSLDQSEVLNGTL